MAIDCLLLAIGFFIAALMTGVVGTDLQAIESSPKVFWLFIAGVIVFGIAEICIALSITSKNATLAGLIEISYPLFIILFSHLLFKESHVNWGITFGGLLIFCGVAAVYWFSR